MSFLGRGERIWQLGQPLPGPQGSAVQGTSALFLALLAWGTGMRLSPCARFGVELPLLTQHPCACTGEGAGGMGWGWTVLPSASCSWAGWLQALAGLFLPPPGALKAGYHFLLIQVLILWQIE